MTPDQSTPRPVESAEEERLKDKAWKHAVEEFEHRRGFIVSPMTWDDRQYGVELRLSRDGYLAGYAAARTALALSERKAQRTEWEAYRATLRFAEILTKEELVDYLRKVVAQGE